MASSEIYRDLLLKHKHGLPLWIPDPDENLEEHKKHGISIGDLGFLTNDGGFEYLFNIHAKADDSINKDMEIPASFEPLRRSKISKRRFHDPKACIVQNANLEIGGTVGGGANFKPGASTEVDLNFTTTKERTAMLYLPRGADREDAEAIQEYKNYATRYGESWYKFFNEELKYDVPNTSLYLVTGCDKSDSWALTAGSPQRGSSFRFSIEAGLPAAASTTVSLHTSWSNPAGMEMRHRLAEPMKDGIEVQNQCVFIRGLLIAVPPFAKPFGPHLTINGTTMPFPAFSTRSPFQSTARESQESTSAPQSPPQDSTSMSGPGDFLDQEEDALTKNSYISENICGVMVQNYPEYPKQVLNPGSYICEHLLSSRPDINLVVVHDNDWMAVTPSDAEDIFTANGPDYERLTSHVLTKCHLQVTQGNALLLQTPYQDLATTIDSDGEWEGADVNIEGGRGCETGFGRSGGTGEGSGRGGGEDGGVAA